MNFEHDAEMWAKRACMWAILDRRMDKGEHTFQKTPVIKTKNQIRADEVAVAGDTDSDIQAGLAASVKIIAGVTSGAATRAQLETAGATVILNFTTEILQLL